MNIDILEEQIIDLQARLTFQEDMIQSLNMTVAEQDKALTTLRLQLQHWESRLEGIACSVESRGNVGNEKPPHY